MQRVCSVPGGVKSYCRESLRKRENRDCPFCPANHLLHYHGFYLRNVLLEQEDIVIEVQRLRCARMKRTVSLLPDFCLPYRQTSVAVVGAFLWGYLLKGLALCRALVRARPGCRLRLWHSTAQRLLQGFRHQAERIRAWLSMHRYRWSASSGIESEANLLRNLMQGSDPPSSLLEPGRQFHGFSGFGLCMVSDRPDLANRPN
jgi:hypothetical protein